MIELVQENNLHVINRIIEIDQEAFGSGGMNEWHLLPLVRHGRVFVIKENDCIMGSIQYLLDWDNRKKAYLFGIAIAKEGRSKGFGSKLIAGSFSKLTKDDIEEIELTVDPANTPAINVYQKKFGFVVTEFRKNEYGHKEDRLIMTLNLKNKI